MYIIVYIHMLCICTSSRGVLLLTRSSVLRSINNVRGTQCFGLWSFLSTVVAGCCLYAALHYSPDTAV